MAMVYGIQTEITAQAEEVFIPEFGPFRWRNLDRLKRYQGRLYRLTAEACKSLSEISGFTIQFDSPSIRESYLDLSKAEGSLVVDLDRNAKPSAVNLRYMRDRWSAVEPNSGENDALRPWIKTTYSARFLPEKVFAAFAEHLKMKPADLEHFYLRLNLKDRTVGLISEDQHVEQFPAGAFLAFALPEGHRVLIPTSQLTSEPPAPATFKLEPYRQLSDTPAEPGVRYASYSKSEIDRMLKLQSDSISNTLSGKVSNQQRLMQEALTAQEKNMAKIADRFTKEFSESKTRLESSLETSRNTMKSELAQFNAQLSKELGEHRAQLNRALAPIAKSLEEKANAIEMLAKEQLDHKRLKFMVLSATGVIVLTIGLSVGLLFTSLSKSSDLSDVRGRLDRIIELMPTPSKAR